MAENEEDQVMDTDNDENTENQIPRKKRRYDETC